MIMTTISDDDVLMVTDRLGLTADDVEDVRQALEDVTDLGFQLFIDQTLMEAETALKAAGAGEQPTDEFVRRVKVRGRIAEGLKEMLELRELLERHQGPAH
jgi:hypothetical protein